MEYVLTPHSRAMPPYAYWEGAFNEEQLNWLQKQAINGQQEASVGGNGNSRVDPQVRRSWVNWLSSNSDTQWVFETLGRIVSTLNAQFYGFDLVGFGEPMQLTRYDELENGMYEWHIDVNSIEHMPSRKLSVVCQLSHPTEYEGGLLELNVGGREKFQIKKQRGFVVVFPSWTLHQVTPVTQGSRQSLVAWMSGPPFK